MADRYEYEGLESAEAAILARASDIAYVTLIDVTNWRNPDPCGRYDLEDDVASTGPAGLRDAVEDERGDGDDDDDGEEPARETEEDETPGRIVGETPAERAITWIRATSARHTIGDAMRKFRVRCYAPKGSSLVWTDQFVVRDQRADPYGEEVLSEIGRQLPPASPAVEAQRAEANVSRAVKVLGDGYAQFMAIMLGAVAQLQQINQVTTSRLLKQNEESADQVETLMAAVINMKIADSEQRTARDVSETEAAAREKTVQKAFEGFERLSSAYLVSQGVPPEFASILSKTPELKQFLENAELRAALEDPDVRALLRDPANLKELAALLNHVAQQNKAKKAKAGES